MERVLFYDCSIERSGGAHNALDDNPGEEMDLGSEKLLSAYFLSEI